MSHPISALDVVIVNFNSRDALKKCIHSLNLSKHDGIKVIVVDNNSSDNSCGFIKQLDDQVQLVKNSENVGFSKACNQGVKLGHCDHIGIINPDCFIDGGQLKNLSEQLAKDNEAALIGCRVLNQDGSLQAASRRRLPTFWRIVMHMTKLSKLPFVQGINIIGDGMFNTIKQVEAVNGACFVVKRHEFNQLGGYDESYPLHFEDLDLFVRIQKLRRHVLYDSSEEVIHLQGQADQQQKKIIAWKKQGLLRYLEKHRPSWEYKVAKFFLGVK